SGKRNRMKPVARAGVHAKAGEQSAGATQDKEKKEYDGGRVHIEGGLAGGGDVDHIIEGRNQELGGVRLGPWGCCGGEGLAPYLLLQADRIGADRLNVRRCVSIEARGHIVAEELVE